MLCRGNVSASCPDPKAVEVPAVTALLAKRRSELPSVARMTRTPATFTQRQPAGPGIVRIYFLSYERYTSLEEGYTGSGDKNNSPLHTKNRREGRRDSPGKNDEDDKVRWRQHPPLARQPRGAQLDELRRHPPQVAQRLHHQRVAPTRGMETDRTTRTTPRR